MVQFFDMARRKSDKSDNSRRDGGDDVSILGWIWMMFICAIPFIGWIMILYWAFAGHNRTRQNYFRAILVFCLLLLAFYVALVGTGVTLAVVGANFVPLQHWLHQHGVDVHFHQ